MRVMFICWMDVGVVYVCISGWFVCLVMFVFWVGFGGRCLYFGLVLVGVMFVFWLSFD